MRRLWGGVKPKYLADVPAQGSFHHAGGEVTLTLSNSRSVHISKFPMAMYKSYAIATPKHSRPLLPKNYVDVAVFWSDFRRACLS